MTEPPKDKLYQMVLKEGATQGVLVPGLTMRYALRGNAVRLFLAQRGLCFHCGKEMYFNSARPNAAGKAGKRYRLGYTEEHIIPKIKGGGYGANIVLAHSKCNATRGIRELTADDLTRRDAIWAIAATFNESVIYRMARNMDIRGQLFEETWLHYKGGFSGTTW